MMNWLLVAELLGVLALIFGVIQAAGRWRRRRSAPRLGYLGTVSEHWLMVHRAEQ
jgi:hypothetical protein